MPKAIVALPVIASAVIVGSIVTLLWIAGSASGQRDRFSSLEIAPKDADILVAINTDPTSPQWLAANNSLDAINAKDPIRRAIDEALAEFDLDWDEDILPVAGDEAYFSVPDIPRDDEQLAWLAGIRLADPDHAREIFDKLAQKAEDEGEEPLQEAEYHGVTIYYGQTPVFNGVPSCGDGGCTVPEEKFEEGTALAFVEDVLAIASTPDDVESVIDVVQKRAPSAEENERLQEFRQYQREDFLVWGYADLAEVWDLLEASLPPTLDTSGPNCFEIEPGVHACSAKLPVSFPDLTPVSDYVEFAADHQVSDITVELPLKETLTTDARAGFYTYNGSGWSLAAELTLEDGGNVAAAQFASLPKNVVVLRDDSPLPDTPPPPDLDPPDADLRVVSLDADYTVVGGQLQVTERIDVDFGDTPKHGIFRDVQRLIDYDLQYDQRVGLTGEVQVLRDGVPEPFEVTPETGMDTFRFQIGDPNVEITGEHLYEIRYTVAKAVRQPYNPVKPYYEIAWNVTGDAWAVPIESASATFTSADGPLGYWGCQEGPDPASLWAISNDENCEFTISDDGLTVRFDTAQPIAPGSGLAFYVQVEGVAGAADPELVPDDDNLSGFEDFLSQFEPEEPEDTSVNPLEVAPFDMREVLDELRGTYDRVGFAITSFDEGFAFDVNVVHAPGFEPDQRYEPVKEYESTLAELVPADTMFFFSYYDLYSQSWLPAQDRIADFELDDGSPFQDFMDEFENEVGLDLDSDILALLTGEIAVAGDVTFDNSPDFQVLALADVNDEQHAEDTLNALEDYLERNGFIAGNRRGDTRVWQLIDSPEAADVGILLRDGQLILGYPDDAVSDAGSGESLADTHDWQRTMDLLPDGKTFVAFFSVARVIDELESSGYDETLDESTDGEIGLADLEAIRSIGFSGTARDDGFGFHAVLFMEDR